MKIMLFNFKLFYFRAGKEYEAIAEKAMTHPANTAGLMELVDFIKKTEDVSLKNLENSLNEIIENVMFLSDYWLLSEAEISSNNNAFTWYHKIPKILEANRKIIETKTEEFQASLKLRYQKFEEELESYSKQVDEIEHWGPDIEEIFRYQKKAQNIENKLIAAMEKIDKFNEEETSFGWEITQYPLRKKIADRLVPFKKLFDSTCEFLIKHEKWTGAMIGAYAPEDIDTDVGIAYRTIYKLEKSLEFEPKELASIVKDKIENFKNCIPVIMTLGNSGMKPRHWDEVSAIIGIPIKVDAELSLGKILNMGLDDYIEKFEGIAEAAIKESSLEKNIDKMQKDWQQMSLTVNPYKDTGTFVIASVDEIQLMLDDHITKAMTMKNSAYIKPFEGEILKWEAKLHLLQDILDQWLKVQGTWMYLEPIFTSPDIQQQMPDEGRKFSAVDKTWRDIMKTVNANPLVMSAVEIDKMLERLKKSMGLLELIQKGLNDYLEKKRLYFPRFFFLSNDELLEILSETKDPTRYV